MRWARRLSSNRLNRMIVLSACLTCSLIPASLHAETRVALLWKARALEASETMQSITAQMKAIPLEQRLNSKRAMQLACKMQLEYAYAAQLLPDMKDIVHKTYKGDHFFHMTFNAGERGLLDFVYVYDQADQLTMARLDSLPKGWHAIFVSFSRSTVQVLERKDGCLFSFDLNDPFSSKVLD